MPKMKTCKAVKKRFKLTKSGKLLACRAGKKHLLTDHKSKYKRGLRGWKESDTTDYKRITRLLPYGRS